MLRVMKLQRKWYLSAWCLSAVAGIGMGGLVHAQRIVYPWRFEFGPRFGFHIKADFRCRGILPPANIGPASGGGIDRIYEDGFVRVDSGGNQGGRTWYWGYQNAGQVDLNNDTISMHAMTSTTAVSFKDIDDDPQPGGEILAARIVGTFGGAFWGFDGGVLYQNIDIDHSSTFPATIMQITDTYSLGGIIPPYPPYAGSYEGPGPAISDSPTRTVATHDATVYGTQKISTDAYMAKFGPFLEVPMGEPLSLTLGGGLLVAYLDSEFKWHQSFQLDNGIQRISRYTSNSDDWMVGGYVRAQLNLDFTSRISVYGGAEYQAMETVSISGSTYKVDLSLGDAVYGVAGIRIRF